MKILMIPYTFVVMNWAPVAGLYYFLRGKEAGREIWLNHKLNHGTERERAPGI